MIRAVLTLFLLSLLSAAAAQAETLVLEADRDATLIEDPDGLLANGSGPVFFAGRTNQERNSLRRALLYFDVASALPPGAVVERAALTLHVTPSNSRPAILALHRVQHDWGEGPSSASGGSGADAEPGDATWLHTFFDEEGWARPGGDFPAAASAATRVDGDGSYTWESRRMAAEVQSWAASDHPNRGWILLGDEANRQNVKALASRENPDPALRPRLEITYRLPGGSR